MVRGARGGSGTGGSAFRVGLAVAGLIVLCAGCGGLDPGDAPPETVVQGTVAFTGGAAAWPDSIVEVRVVFFNEQPLAPDSVLGAILNLHAAFSDTLELKAESDTYRINITAAPQTYRYVVVAGRTGPDLLKDWLMLALHAKPGMPSVPEEVHVAVGDARVVDFTVDFANLPPQPF
jgi:hypothetical protein